MSAPRDVKVDLPELPEMKVMARGTGMGPHDVYYTPMGYTAEQMRDYARSALADVEAEVRGLSASLSDAFDLLRDHEAALAAATARGEGVVDLGETGVLLNATVTGCKVIAARLDQVDGCTFIGEISKEAGQ